MKQIPWIWGPPYAGKTTLHKDLLKRHIPVWETDEQRGKLPGWRDELWRAWRPDHPDHAEWSKLNDQHKRDHLQAIKEGKVVITHSPPPAGFKGFLLMPDYPELAKRAAADLEKRGNDALWRVDALLHYINTKDATPKEATPYDQIIKAVVSISDRDEEPEVSEDTELANTEGPL
jgi:hypothetical protein